MPNLNLRGADTPEEPQEIMQEINESDQTSAHTGSALKRALPLVAGATVALLLAFYILNKIGIVHLWGNKQASSVMIVPVTSDSTQVLSDSAMAEQFRKDSLEAVAQVAKEKSIASKDNAPVEKKSAPVVQKSASVVQKPAPVVQKKEAIRTEAAVQRNMTTVEVPGSARRQASSAQTEGAEYVTPASRKPLSAAAGVKTKAPVREPAREPARAAKAAEGEATYSVQLSSWMSLQKAQAQAARFTNAGVPAFVYTEGHVHRVCTGHFSSASAATARAEELVPMLETKYDIIIVK